MKIALLGKGKTGSQVIELSPAELEVFDRSNPPRLSNLEKHDVIISFLPGDAFRDLIPMLIETGKPVVTGSTGFQWPLNFENTLQEKNLTWVHATNFSLGVVVLKQLIERLHQFDSLFSEKKFSIHEVHHTKKIDSPSGTAISMKEWLQNPCDITSERVGDVVGLHTLTLETTGEILRLEHEAKNRTVFAQGAVWVANYITKNKIGPGLHSFQKIVESHLSP